MGLLVAFIAVICSQIIQSVTSENCHIDINDELWSSQWYLNKGAGDLYDMNVFPSWRNCINGTGVTVGVVDKGVQDHFDLNIDRSLSYSIGEEDSIRNLKHGTRVAGIIGALQNDNLTVGIAFGAVIADIDIASTSVWETLDMEAMTYNMNKIDIYSCSFANFHTGTRTYPLLKDQERAFKFATEKGRNGLGNIYVFATGNSGGPEDSIFIDSCAYDRLVTNRYVISVAGIQHDLTKVPNGEACSAMLVAAFTAKAGARHHKLVTSDVGNSSTEYFNQNSAAAPMVSGAVALALSANPKLTYRDVMHLLVLTSRNNLPEFKENFTRNAANLSASSYFGFGLLDIGELVNRSLTWTNVPRLRTCTADNTYNISLDSPHIIVHIDSCNVSYSEHVEVSLKVNHNMAGQIRWVLISPYGTRSTILRGRGLDPTKAMNLTVLTVQMWGENPNGYWKLEAIPVFGANLEHGKVALFSLSVFGYTCEHGCLEPAKQEVIVNPECNADTCTDCYLSGPNCAWCASTNFNVKVWQRCQPVSQIGELCPKKAIFSTDFTPVFQNASLEEDLVSISSVVLSLRLNSTVTFNVTALVPQNNSTEDKEEKQRVIMIVKGENKTPVNIDIESDCKKGIKRGKRYYCKNIKRGRQVKIEVSVRLQWCPRKSNGKYNVKRKITVKIGKEKRTIRMKIKCECECRLSAKNQKMSCRYDDKKTIGKGNCILGSTKSRKERSTEPISSLTNVNSPRKNLSDQMSTNAGKPNPSMSTYQGRTKPTIPSDTETQPTMSTNLGRTKSTMPPDSKTQPTMSTYQGRTKPTKPSDAETQPIMSTNLGRTKPTIPSDTETQPTMSTNLGRTKPTMPPDSKTQPTVSTNLRRPKPTMPINSERTQPTD